MKIILPSLDFIYKLPYVVFYDPHKIKNIELRT